MSSLDPITSHWPHGVMLYRRRNGTLYREPIAFVFDVPPGGFGTVSPAYYDQEVNGSPQDHYFPVAEVNQIGNDFEFRLPNGDTGYIYQWQPGTLPQEPALDWLRAHFESSGVNVRDEYEAVRQKFLKAWGLA